MLTFFSSNNNGNKDDGSLLSNDEEENVVVLGMPVSNDDDDDNDDGDNEHGGRVRLRLPTTTTTTTTTRGVTNERTPLIRRSSSLTSISTRASSSVRSVQPLPGMKIRAHCMDTATAVLTPCTTRQALKGNRQASSTTATTATTVPSNPPSPLVPHSQQERPPLPIHDNTAAANTTSPSSQCSYWIDIDADEPDKHELDAWLCQLKLTSFIHHRLAQPFFTWTSQVLVLPGAVLVLQQILPSNRLQSQEITHVACLIARQDLFITLNACPRSETEGLHAPTVAFIQQAMEGLPVSSLSPSPSSSPSPPPHDTNNNNNNNNDDTNNNSNNAMTSTGLLVAWLLYHVQRTQTCTRELRTTVWQMDQAMDRGQDVPWEDIIAAKEQLLRLLSVAQEQGECLEALAAQSSMTSTATTTSTTTSCSSTTMPRNDDYHQGANNNAAAATTNQPTAAAATSSSSSSLLVWTPELQGLLGVLRATAGGTERTAMRLEKHLTDLRHRYEAQQHQHMNRRLATLTVLSAIFLPLTLLTGIWGMNFEDMPELSHPAAYPLALCFMVSIALFMVCYFRREGYFG